MYLVVKCNSLKIVRTVPKIWINYVDSVPHCWIPKTGYSYKLKNLAEPPNETDVQARREWHFFEGEILFNKEFKRLNDGEMALSKLDLGPEWFYVQEEVICTVEESSVIEQDPLSAEVTNSSSESKIPAPSTLLTDLEQYEENKRLCSLHNFKPPIHYRKFEKMVWPYVNIFNADDLKPSCQFRTLDELSLIPRKHEKPFCHPGPEKRGEFYDWYLADSIIQEVYLKSDSLPSYVVRWVGYEDEYNTVEPFAYVKDTAIYKLFTSPNTYTACRSNDVCIRRRSAKRMPQKMAVKLPMDIGQSKYELAINKLAKYLRIEETVDRYSPLIGFYSYESVAAALVTQHRFFIDTFVLLIRELKSEVYLDNHYIGEMCGNLHTAAEFKEMTKWGIKKPNTIKTYIQNGLLEAAKTANDRPHYVSFLVPRKYGNSEKKNKKQLNFHMCVYTVRSYGGLKDAIYYDPTSNCFGHGVPKVLSELKKPVMQSFTQKFGVASERDDCMYQCMCYIIGLATNEILFQPDFLEPCRKIDRYAAEIASKKAKIEN